MNNLLPSQEKKALLLEEHFKIALILAVLFLLFLSFLSLILFSLKIYISKQIALEKEKTASYRAEIEGAEVRTLREQTSAFNAEILKINSFFKEQFFLTGALEYLVPLFPGQTYLISLSYNKDKESFTVIGFAPTREILFQLKENFEAKERIEDFYFPPSNWVDPKDINFTFSFRLDDR